MECLHRWRSWIRPLVISVYFILLVVGLPLMVWEFNSHGTESHVQAWFVGGLFVAMAIPISLWGILQHLVNYTQPVLQRHIVRILWMVPVYAMNAWLALRFKEAAIYLDTLRECYEAYVIYNFMSYLMQYLRTEIPNIEATISFKEQVKHFIPFCCFPPWPMGSTLIERCRHGVLQYVVVRPLTTIIALCCEWGKVYDEGDFNFTTAWSYLVIINNISQIWAMYCLVLFYRATKEELAPMKPVPKFLCVKAVVFLSFWQSLLIAALVKLGVIKQDSTWVFYDIKDVATGLQDFCICVEMFLAAVAHYYSFSHQPFIDYSGDNNTDCCVSFMSMWDVSDVRDDVVDHVRHVGNTVTRPLRRPMSGETERTPLLKGSSGQTSQGLLQCGTPQLSVDVSDLSYDTPFEGRAEGRGRGRGLDCSIDAQDGEAFHTKSLTPSMNNFADFDDSVDLEAEAFTGSIDKGPPVHGAIIHKQRAPAVDVGNKATEEGGSGHTVRSSTAQSSQPPLLSSQVSETDDRQQVETSTDRNESNETREMSDVLEQAHTGKKNPVV